MHCSLFEFQWEFEYNPKIYLAAGSQGWTTFREPTLTLGAF